MVFQASVFTFVGCGVVDKSGVGRETKRNSQECRIVWVWGPDAFLRWATDDSRRLGTNVINIDPNALQCQCGW